MKPFLLGLLSLFVIETRAQFTTGSTTYNGNFIGFYQFKPPGYDPNSSHKYPLIISLAGVGEQGNGTTELPNMLDAGLPLYCSQGATLTFNYQGQQESFLMLAPQLSKSAGVWDEVYTDGIIAYAKANLNVDVNRIFLTGFSLGGGGVWRYVTSSAARAANIAGIVPISASPDYYTNGFCYVAQNQVATWAFQATDDATTPPSITGTAIAGVNGCSPQIPARERLYPDGSHAIWNTKVYDTTNYWQYPNIYQWMMKVSRSINVAADQPPVANAGTTNITLMVPVRDEDIVLNGLPSTDADDIVSVYKWTQLAGTGATTWFPSTTGYGQADSSERPVATIVYYQNGGHNWLDPGTYNYNLSIKDYKSQVSTTTIHITVALPSSGNALPGAWISDPDSVVLSSTQTSTGFFGTGKDWDGALSSYSWQQILGPQTLSVTTGGNGTSITNVNTPGIYKIVFTVTDNQGGTGTDTATILKLGSALPVTWLYFKGISVSGQAQLSWAIAQESNNDHFDVQRSASGTGFTTIGSVSATNIANGSVYGFTDAAPPHGSSYYRLQQVDKDGKATFSHVITVNNTGNGYAIETYPNPAKDNLSVVLNGNLYGNLQVMVTDMQGRIVRQEQWAKNQSALTKNIDLIGLQSGLYQLILVSPDGKKETTGFVKY
ncbi:MAG TPA: T9SS type A sorting domain-containing protein [Chitinophagaceae bacterium]|jgi:dienelactone hydrolase